MASHTPDASLAVALTGSRWVALVGTSVATIIIAGMPLVTADAGREEFRAANAMTARAVAGYLTVVAPVDAGTDYQLIGLLSAVHTLASSPRWGRGIQVAWGNSPLLPDSLHLAPLDSATRRRLDDQGTAVLERTGRQVALVPLLDKDLGHTIGWVAAWGMLAPGARDLARLGFLALILVATMPVLLLPAGLLRDRIRWALVLLASTGALVLALHEDHRLRKLAARRTAVVEARVRLLVDRAISMPRVDQRRLGQIAVGPSQPGVGWSRLERTLAGGVGGFVLVVCVGAWSQTRGRGRARRTAHR